LASPLLKLFKIYMKTRLIFLVSISMMLAASVSAQVSVTGAGQTFSEGFDSFVGTQASVPVNFTFSDTDYTPGGFYTFTNAYDGANSNYAFRASAVSTDIAFGQKGPTSGTDFLNWSFVNNSGSSISSVVISWTALQYSAGGRAPTITQNYNLNNTGFVTTGLTGNVFTSSTGATPSGAQLASIVSTSFSYTLTFSTPWADGQSLVLGWGFANGAGSSSNGHIAVDNLSLSVPAVPEPSSFALIAGGLTLGGVLMQRRRKAVVA
jgi:trimeric autotransporter adhesin